jgi:2-oxoglutarate dehydrogenase E1 component
MSDPASGHRASTSASQSVNGWSSEYIEQLYMQWRSDPAALGESWNQFFLGFDLGTARPTVENAAPVDAAASRLITRGPLADPSATQETTGSKAESFVSSHKQQAVDGLIAAYRMLGHLAADLDPLGTQRQAPRELTLAAFGLSEHDLDRTFATGTLPLGENARLRDILTLLQDTYCRTIGAEFGYVACTERRLWLQERMESTGNRATLDAESKRRALSMLIKCDSFENFLATRYIGKKRFGLEGGDSLLVILDSVLESAAKLGATECVLGMAHRGRVNVLHNIAGKKAEIVLTEFDELWHESFAQGGGDVKYHLGHTGDYATLTSGNISVSICPNPSHLEFVCSVVTGRTRARQERAGPDGAARVLPVLIHGDAALPGQGVVSETLNMAQLDGYAVGGTVHVVINNQVGFTTDNRDSFYGPYCTGVAKSIEAPVLHVNAGDAEACVWVAQLAADWRAKFGDDIFIDMWCWRKNGHNESDEPNFTQPHLYKRIRAAVPLVDRYAQRLQSEGVVTAQQVEADQAATFAALDEAQQRVKVQPVGPGAPPFRGAWSGITANYTKDNVETAVPLAALQKVAKQLAAMPQGFEAHKTVDRGVQARGVLTGTIDWAMGELLAYGTLILEGGSVRLTGQDVLRGTFSHRHAAVIDQETNTPWIALQHLPSAKGRFDIYNSPLTETACVGFEYGYSLVDPMCLVIWEAQFGDFCNGAQVIFDQFMAAGEAKWFRATGMTVFLPHGYEGQGPEHSSGRLERFLALAAQDNLQVIYPTNSAQVFHMLRRQLRRNVRKPLVVMTPKSMLRLPAAQSHVDEFVKGQFHTVLPDPRKPDPATVTRLLFCSGKVFHEADAQRAANGNTSVALVRVEQLYPFPADELAAQLSLYKNAEPMWFQEEPRNMGAWRFMQDQFLDRFDRRLAYLGRPAQASPAVASLKAHGKEQSALLHAAVGAAVTSTTTADGHVGTGDGPAGKGGSGRVSGTFPTRT